MRTFAFFLILGLAFTTSGRSQETIIPLWPNEVPLRIEADETEIQEKGDILKISKVQVPEIEVYLPSKANATGQGVLIFPGGGYHILAYDWEGRDIAKMLNTKGIAGIVVKNRLPTSASLEKNHLAPLVDAQRALRLVKSMAKDFNLDTDKIGIIGFSAGGHLTASLGAHYDKELIAPVDEIDLTKAKPNFIALVYPVIQFGAASTHMGSQTALLGENPTQEWIDFFSLEQQVRDDHAPTILFHSTDDTAVPVENSLSLYNALRQKNVPSALHIFPHGGHGFGLAPEIPLVNAWPKLLTDWIRSL
ncbi:alpha/beta hydrolase [Croceivirga thetidis]|uniref:Alpha/beta hydrolase n=1 Tax=Croceivirga thetidis TaxID=2721623 RepID=A0ABX1GKX7_9FLAO|nr:alpha/beta hydrolase [Croceivirga thetidis]NKI30511.1 alpha/beta hydrolase [Croceivirga thetidis]